MSLNLVDVDQMSQRGAALRAAEKRCAGCKTTKPLFDFWKQRSTKDGYQVYCKSCKSAISRKNYLRDKRYTKNKSIKNKYGISLAAYELMIVRQNGLCAICGEKAKKLVIDHNHVTGKVRELLCYNCNSILGKARESVDILERTIAYIEKHDN